MRKTGVSRIRLGLATALLTSFVVALSTPSNNLSLSLPQPSSAMLVLPTDNTIASSPLETADNLSISATPITCYTQPPITQPQYRPIVLEDCYKVFSDMFLSPKLMSSLTFTPGTSKYRRQNENCIFSMDAGPNAVKGSHDEIQIGVNLAKITRQCVTAATGYFGGEQQLHTGTGWIVSVRAAGPR